MLAALCSSVFLLLLKFLCNKVCVYSLEKTKNIRSSLLILDMCVFVTISAVNRSWFMACIDLVPKNLIHKRKNYHHCILPLGLTVLIAT